MTTESWCPFRPPYRYEASVHGPVTIYDAVGVGWVARVKESLPHKQQLAQTIVDALNEASAAAYEARAAELEEYGDSLPEGVSTEAFAEATNLRYDARSIRDAKGGDA